MQESIHQAVHQSTHPPTLPGGDGDGARRPLSKKKKKAKKNLSNLKQCNDKRHLVNEGGSSYVSLGTALQTVV